MLKLGFRFHHVGVVTGDIDSSTSFFGTLGYSPSQAFDDPEQKARIVLLTAAQGPLVELISPTSEKSPAAGWVKRIEAGAYHICYEVDDIEKAGSLLRKDGTLRISKPVPAVAFGGRRVAFFWHKSAGLLELVEA